MTTYIDGPDLSVAEQIAYMISGKTPEAVVKTDVRPVLIRVPLNDLLHLDAMAQLSGKSRNQMAVMLLRAGMDAVYNQTDDETKQRVNNRILGIAESVLSDPENQTDAADVEA